MLNKNFCVRLIVILLLVASFQVMLADDSPPDISDWLANHAIPFLTDDPEGDLRDLAPLTELIGEARIVGLGEATHGTAEFFRMKHRIYRYLVENEGFRVFMIEANMPESMAMNDYILHGEGTAREELDGLLFWTWRTQEVLDMVEWMREWNINHADDPIYFVGFDAQFWEDGVKRFLDYLEQVEPEFARAVREPIHCFGEAGKRPTPTKHCKITLQKIKYSYAASRERYIEDSSELDYLLHRQVLESLVYVEALYTALPGDDFNIRDKGMAEQVMAFAEDIFPDERIVLWAHNVHMQSIEIEERISRPMGIHLRGYFGDDYINVGFAFNTGSFMAVRQYPDGRYGSLQELTVLPPLPDSHEIILSSVDSPRYLLDMRVAPDSPAYDWLSYDYYFRVIGAVYNPDAEFEQFAYRLPLLDMFDILIYFEDTSPSTLLR